MTENLKIWLVKNSEFNERYFVIAETEDEVMKLLEEDFKDSGLEEDEKYLYYAEVVDWYDIKKGVAIREESS